MNRATFDFVVENDLYYVEGQERFFNEHEKVDFPVESREIKAQWRRLDDPARFGRYHTTTIRRSGRTETWGLTALHITTKDLPNWFWATFEHVDNEGREAVVPSRDDFGLGESGPSEALLDLFEDAGLGDKWHHYVLRGTQVDFVDSLGRPTILANSQIERGFQSTSSCITCHARASIGPKPEQSFSTTNPQDRHARNRLAVFESDDPLVGSIGVPNPSWFVDDSTAPRAQKFAQLDFVWSLFRARRRFPFPGPVVEPIPRGARDRAVEPSCCGSDEPGDPPGDRAGSVQSVDPGSTMSAERRAEIVRNATRFASDLADDDEQFLHLASTAIGQALLSELDHAGDLAESSIRRAAVDPTGEVVDAPRPAVGNRTVWKSKTLQQNFRKLLAASGDAKSGLAPVVGPPATARVVGPGATEVRGVAFRDCVAVGSIEDGVTNFCCTGTVVAPNLVVTAAHCLECAGDGQPGRAVVFVGNDVSQAGRTYTGRIVKHGQFNRFSFLNDVAVIVLDTPIPNVTPRRLATTAEIDGSTFGRVVGFGHDNNAGNSGFGVKRLVDVPIASHACNGTNEPSQLGCHANLEIVAGFVGLGPDSCRGDSGGPFYVLVGDDARDDGAWALAGATSRATSLATRMCGDGGHYTRLDRYVDFIGLDDDGDGGRADAFAPPGPFEGLPLDLAARVAARDRRADDIAPRAVFEKALRWPQQSEITVAFLGGSNSAREQVEELANTWAQHGNFSFSFRKDDDSFRTWTRSDTDFGADIRVAFDRQGYWSLLGTDSRNSFVVLPSQASMSLSGMADGNLSANERGTVVHEFGHALGFHHEHQTPEGGCDDEFRWENDPGYVPTTDSLGRFVEDDAGRRPGIYQVLGGPPNNWPRARVDFNLRQLENSSAFDASEHDPESVMHYSFGAWMFVNGSQSHCHTERNNTLSVEDVNGVKRAYPVGPSNVRSINRDRKRVLDRYPALDGLISRP